MEKVINQRMKVTSIGLIPEDWDAKALSQIGVFSKGKGVTRANSQSGDIPCVRYGEIYTSHNNYIRAFYSHISPEIAATATRLKNGDILFAGSGETKEEIGKAVAFLGVEEAYAGGDIIILSPNEGASSKYLGYVLNAAAAVSQKASMGQGDAVVHIHAKELGDVIIPFPKHEEQEKIANALSSVDDMIGTLDESIAKKRQIKEGLMQQLLTGKTRLPGFCGEWKESTLGQLADICKGVQFDSDLFSENGRYPMLNGGITPSGYSEFFNTEADTITISEGGNSCGYVNYMTEKFWCGGHCYSLKVKSTDKLFLYQLLKFNEKDIMALRVGSGLPNVQSKSLIDFRLYYSENEQEQKSISIILKKADDEIANLESQRDKYILIKQGMMQELLTGKTRLI